MRAEFWQSSVYLAVGGDDSIVDVAGGVDTETLAGVHLPQQAAVDASVTVDVGLQPGVAGGQARWNAFQFV
jgi:hypothetical protein